MAKVFFSWYGASINGVPYPLIHHGGNAKRICRERNLRNAARNRQRFGNRKALRRAIRRARGLMDDAAVGKLLRATVS